MAESTAGRVYLPAPSESPQAAQADTVPSNPVIYCAETDGQTGQPAEMQPPAAEQSETREDIAGAFQNSLGAITNLIHDAAFRIACGQVGINWLGGQRSPEYWRFVAKYLQAGIAKLRCQGHATVRMDALELLAVTPAFLFALKDAGRQTLPAEAADPAETYGTRLRALQNAKRHKRRKRSTSGTTNAGDPRHYFELVRSFAAKHPALPAPELHTALLNIIVVSFDRHGERQAAVDDLRRVIYQALELDAEGKPHLAADSATLPAGDIFDLTEIDAQEAVSHKDVAGALSAIRQSMGELVIDKNFQLDCMQHGFAEENTDSPAYWQYFTEYMRRRLGVMQERGASNLHIGALTLLSVVPAFVTDYYRALQSPEKQYSLKKRAECQFAELVREFATDFPTLRASDLVDTVQGVANTIFTQARRRDFAAQCLAKVVSNLQQRMAFGQILSAVQTLEGADSFDFWRADSEIDGLGTDYIVCPAPGRLLAIEIRAEDGEPGTLSQTSGGKIVAQAPLTGQELADRFRIHPALARRKASAVYRQIVAIEQQVA